jgi:hypothetical protein
MKGFRLNEVCTTEKGARYIGTGKYVQPSYYEMDGWEETCYLAFQLMPEGYSNDEVVVSENRLFIGGYEVKDYGYWVNTFSSLSNQIPRYFVIRKYNGEYYEFEGGFDLLNDGTAWQGITRKQHNSISDALQFVRERVGDDFTIFLEEPLRM